MTKLKARQPRGLRDCFADWVSARRNMIATIGEVYERYGFEPLETPVLEYVESLGKFLPDVDRPMGGVFAFRDDDEEWLAMRYDLTAPLARLVAMNTQTLPRPFRRYQVGPVYRNEKPGPGRYREFYQFDADTVGSPLVAADAELTIMLSETLERLGIEKGDYIIKVNNRKLLVGVLEQIGLTEDDGEKRGIVQRAIDKMDRLGEKGVRLLLGAGRKDESGDFTKGADLSNDQIDVVMAFLNAKQNDNAATLSHLRQVLGKNEMSLAGVNELEQVAELAAIAGCKEDRIVLDPSVVRGLAYYTGSVFEAELTFGVPNEKGEIVQFGSVAGGGRYDDLVKRFTGQEMPATGVSIGVDRLLTALVNKNLLPSKQQTGPVLVCVMDGDQLPRYQEMTQVLRSAGIRAELYLGGSGMKAQLKYADKRNAPIAVIEGSSEREQGLVLLKDLYLGAQIASRVQSNEEWRKGDLVQKTVPLADLASEVGRMLEDVKARTTV